MPSPGYDKLLVLTALDRACHERATSGDPVAPGLEGWALASEVAWHMGFEDGDGRRARAALEELGRQGCVGHRVLYPDRRENRTFVWGLTDAGAAELEGRAVAA